MVVSSSVASPPSMNDAAAHVTRLPSGSWTSCPVASPPRSSASATPSSTSYALYMSVPSRSKRVLGIKSGGRVHGLFAPLAVVTTSGRHSLRTSPVDALPDSPQRPFASRSSPAHVAPETQRCLQRAPLHSIVNDERVHSLLTNARACACACTRRRC